MHKYLLHICSFLITFSCFSGAFIRAYVQDGDFFTAPRSNDYILQEEAHAKAPAASLNNPFAELCGESDHHRNSQYRLSYDLFSENKHIPGFCSHLVYSIKLLNNFSYTKTASIYLLDCVLLI